MFFDSYHSPCVLWAQKARTTQVVLVLRGPQGPHDLPAIPCCLCLLELPSLPVHPWDLALQEDPGRELTCNIHLQSTAILILLTFSCTILVTGSHVLRFATVVFSDLHVNDTSIYLM